MNSNGAKSCRLEAGELEKILSMCLTLKFIIPTEFLKGHGSEVTSTQVPRTSQLTLDSLLSREQKRHPPWCHTRMKCNTGAETKPHRRVSSEGHMCPWTSQWRGSETRNVRSCFTSELFPLYPLDYYQ